MGAIRPRFQFTLAGARAEHLSHVQVEVQQPHRRCICRVVTHHLDMTVRREEHHRWTPWLSLEFQEVGETTVVHGIIGPHPSIWTFFAFAAICNTVIASLGLVLGFVQMTLGERPWGFGVLLGAVIIYGLLYAASQIGRRLAEPQTRYLLDVLEEIVGVPMS